METLKITHKNTTNMPPFLDPGTQNLVGTNISSFVSNMGKYVCRSPPMQDTQCKVKKPVQEHTSNIDKLADRIKNLIPSIFTPNCNIQENTKPKCIGFPSMTQRPHTSPCVFPNPMSRPVSQHEAKINQQKISTLYQASFPLQRNAYGNKEGWATRDPVF